MSAATKVRPERSAASSFGLVELVTELTVYTNFTAPGTPGYQLAALTMSLLWVTSFILFFWMLAIFPNGRLPSPRWRWLLGVIALFAASMILSGLLGQPMISAFNLDNPLPVAGLQNLAENLLLLAVILMGAIGVGIFTPR